MLDAAIAVITDNTDTSPIAVHEWFASLALLDAVQSPVPAAQLVLELRDGGER